MLYTEYLTPSERMEAIRGGAAEAISEAGMTPSSFDGLMKASQSRGGGVPVPMPSMTAMANTALMAGVPLGLMYYIVSKSLNKSDRKTKRLQRELDYYNDVVSEFKNNYAARSDDEGDGSEVV